ncbi:hypothetical protein [Streptomyces sp. AJS327]|uniref:hypothetical protein n=1 Tax=Streptomyces sp. AJS327 TaxID=2545265 RepID=UPI0027E41ABF|nr:hypothetical protein [Streptomyces sp. AJS327]
MNSADLDQLGGAFGEILAACTAVLRPGGTVVVVVRPWRHCGELMDLPTSVISAGYRAGLRPIERNVALLAGIRDGGLVPRPSFFQLGYVRDARARSIPLHVIAHEDVIVFRKPKDSVGEIALPLEGVRAEAEAVVSHWGSTP